ncbi:hypothetical protein JOC86_000286 [Bacillus pakistanensis]|uniref:Hydrolase n=1 Tax=Rossellomorea pakistanensis TaxID=992288 RepID=A0ABS2N7F1_9BACI|nr:zinc dependent phospholipase C family protein [Bacillus pakistanensis]MBM7583749.1 hypothetical protein [Bacillus pakistanensis]
MGSRIMHLIIANRISNELQLDKKTSILLGGIAPDAVQPKDLSHFYTGDVMDFSRKVDYEGFFEKYKCHQDLQYVLGYYTHLIADSLWLTGFYLPWLKNRLEKDDCLLSLYHQDFQLLNAKLLQHYGCEDQLRTRLQEPVTIIPTDEVSVKKLKEFLPYVLGDLDYDHKNKDASLNVFTLQQIIGYVETSVQLGLQKVQSKHFSNVF